MSGGQFSETGRKLLEEVGTGANCEIFLVTDQGETVSLWNSGEEFSLEAGKSLFGACFKRKRTVVVHNGQTNSLLRALEGHGVGTAVCSPVFDKYQAIIGILAVWAPEVGRLGKSERYVVERATRDLAERLMAMKLKQDEAKSKEGPSPYAFLYHPITPLLTLGLLLFLVVWSFRPSTTPEVAPTAAVSREERPETVAVDFLENLRSQKYAEAWSLLTPALRRSWSLSAFERDFSTPPEGSDLQPKLSSREISRVVRDGRSAEVILFESELPGDSGRWTWLLSKADGKWRISNLDGPVSSR